jgi:UDP-N-acetylmuramate--alanine ligase
MALEYRVSIKNIQQALANFQGVSRRYEIYNNIVIKDKTIKVIDDYGHHPTEIEAVIKATKKAFRNKKINFVFQPHRFSRTRDCYEEFLRILKTPDRIFLFDIYPAGESKINGISTKALMKSLNHPAMHYLPNFKSAKRLIFDLIEDDSILIIMGAGSVGNFSQNIIQQ